MLTHNIFKDKILIMDGAMGTVIQKYGLNEEDFHTKPAHLSSGCHPNSDIRLQSALQTLASHTGELKGNNECLNLTRPDIIEEIHRDYILAGADIIEANTFSANTISQSEYGTSSIAGILAEQGAAIARAAADKYGYGRRILVCGSVGPTSKSLSLAQDLNHPEYRPYSFRQMSASYEEQIRGLIAGGVDIILIETCFDALNTKAALFALSKISREAKESCNSKITDRFNEKGMFPAIVSVSVSDKSGRTLTGQTLEAFFTSVSHYPLTAFGLNCSLGAEDMSVLLKELASFCPLPTICYPNAGMPDEMGLYTQSPISMADAVRKMGEDGLLNIAGGCCGTTPDHIKAISWALGGLAPRPTPASQEFSLAQHKALKISGLEAVTIDLKHNNFTNIGERTNVAGSRKFARLISEGNYNEGLRIAATQIENGASIIDINMDDAMLDSQKCMETFVRHISGEPAIAKAALMIDSSHWDTILSGLENAQGKCIVNSISLKEGEEEFLRKAATIRELGAAMVVMAFDEKGQATSFERKIEICSRAYHLLTERLDIEPHDIIFDVNVLSVGTGIEEHNSYGIDFIRAVKWIKEHLPGAMTSGGISNLSFAFRGNNTVREAMHSIFLYHATSAGLDMGIVNPGMLQVYDDIERDLLLKAEDVILNRRADATERLIAKAQEILATKETKSSNDGKKGEIEQKPNKSATERLQESLVKGVSDNLEKDIMECLANFGTAVSVIEGPLMSGMERVGELFGSGKMFLPQVVKSAKIMKEAVAILEPYMGENDNSCGSRPIVINATVKGDVHDIGKNIAGIVLTCNGFDVRDLGVMVENERIISEAIAADADIIGVSGLITPSLHQMEELCKEMASKQLSIPLFIGGATTSALHTAVRLTPLYNHVFYSSDASAGAVMAKRCIMDREQFEAEEHAAQQRIRDIYYSSKKISSADNDTDGKSPESQAVAYHSSYSPSDYLRPDEHSLESMPTFSLPISEVMSYFDWRMYLASWGMKYNISDMEEPSVRSTIEDGKAVIDRYIQEESVSIMLSFRIFVGRTDGKCLILYDKENGPEVCRIPMLRRETTDSTRSKCSSLCDYLPSEGLGTMGMFALSVKPKESLTINAYKHGTDCNCTRDLNYDSMTERAVRVTLAEAASEWLGSYVKSHIRRDNILISRPAAGYSSCPDHTLKKDILSLLPDGHKLGISFTESYAMIPDASICGFLFMHTDAGYPEIRTISQKQYLEYSSARGMDSTSARIFLGHLIDLAKLK